MVEIQVRDKESLERALRRFKKKWERAGILRELRSRSFYIKPSDEKREARKKQLEEKPEWQGLKLLGTIHVLLEDVDLNDSLTIGRVIDKVKTNSLLLFFLKGSLLFRALFYFKFQLLVLLNNFIIRYLLC